MKPAREKEKPRLALEARLRAAPLVTSSLRDLRMCLGPRPGDVTPTNFPRLGLRDRPLVPPFEVAVATAATASIGADRLGDFSLMSSSSWSDFVRANPVNVGVSIPNSNNCKLIN